MLKKLQKLLFPTPPLWDWIQVEVTTACNAACVYCPRTVLGRAWPNRHMTLAEFQGLVTALPYSRAIHLQGWGEPLLNPDFLDMARLAKASGVKVGTTTNGRLVDPKMARALVEAGLDLVAFSLAGTAKSNDLIRPGAPLLTVLRAIQELDQAKRDLRSDRPVIHIAYMLWRSKFEEAMGLPDLLAGQGISQVMISTLDFLPSPELVKEALIPATAAEHLELSRRLDALVRLAAEKGLILHYRLADPESSASACPENIDRAVVVTADGRVTPCVYSNLPVAADHPFGGLTGTDPYHPLIMGNIADKGLIDIWSTTEYRDFRQSFKTQRVAPACANCLKLRIGGN